MSKESELNLDVDVVKTEVQFSENIHKKSSLLDSVVNDGSDFMEFSEGKAADH